jgi:L-cysteine desulfidase
MKEKQFLDLLNNEMAVSLGCTEPIAIVIASAYAKQYVKGDKICKISVVASRNVVKNAMSVKIPGTDSCGINLAAALGVIRAGHDKNLEILADLKPEEITKAKEMIFNGLVSVQLSNSKKKLYIEIIIETEKSKSRVVIEDFHDNIVLIELDGKEINNTGIDIGKTEHSNEKLDFLCLDTIMEFIEDIDTTKLDIIKECIKINREICLDGLINPYGLQVGRNMISNMIKNEFLANDIANYATALTAAGSDARMSGSILPVMSNSGSGNQGISATMPVLAFAESLNANEDTTLRAVTLSNLVTIYIKSILGRLSALCGATISATGACCGITFLMGGGRAEVKSSIQNMMGDLTGMVCDGAKAGCAIKIASCTTAAIQCAVISLEGDTISNTDGIIEKDPEDTINNFCKLGNVGMKNADRIILDIMIKKSNSHIFQ